MSLKNLARSVRAAMPEGALRNRLAALAYRVLYGRALAGCAWRDGAFVVRTPDGTEVRSVREFDPAPLADDFAAGAPGAGAVAMDVGGNIGAVASWLARRVGPSGRVVVFEPDAANLVTLRRNLVLNGVANVDVVEKGAWESAGVLEFHAGGNYTSSFRETDYVQKRPDLYQAVCLPVTTIDIEVARLGLARLDLIKMDIEGSEGPALRGARETLRRFRPAVVVETHTVQGRPTLDEVQSILREAGYTEIRVQPDEETPVVTAR
ncbi:MAG: FkbM family methyltransferase [Verrucomicrobia bacterium]|nr:FkbM family methyltransferase [Verrucomicrobiota bacterium]